MTSVKFANDDKTRVACSSIDGSLSVCQVIPPPATVICMLKGHKDGVSGGCLSPVMLMKVSIVPGLL